MTNEKGFAAYNALGHVADDLIMDALLPEDRAAAPVKMKKERPRRLLAFLESGWGVAIICALVAVSVMGGIIWEGNQSGMSIPPTGTVVPESDLMTEEILTDDSEKITTETSESETVFVPTETTRSCTIRTSKDRYEWGVGEKLLASTFSVELTCTVAGAVLDISPYDFELVNLATGKKAAFSYIETSAHMDKTKAFPTAPDAFAHCQKTLAFDWETTPPGRYRLTYTGMELSEGEEYPYYDFEIYMPEPRMAVWGSDTYVIPAEAMLWTEAWDAASQTMIRSESSGWVDIKYFHKYHQLEMPVMRVAPETDIRVAGTEITRCVIYNSDCDIVYQGDSWEAAMECVLKTPADTACFVVFTAYWQGDYVTEANAYEGRAYEYAFCLVVRDW